MKINRVWAMPNKWTFQIKPIKELLNRYVLDQNWIDPFAGYNSPAGITNDINPNAPTTHHMKAIDFVQILYNKEYSGCLFDPPYSLRQLKECYQQHGTDISYEDTIKFYSSLKTELTKKIIPGGYCISFGWNSNGFGKKRGFEIVEILLVAHGRDHNDTIITVEKKIQDVLF